MLALESMRKELSLLSDVADKGCSEVLVNLGKHWARSYDGDAWLLWAHIAAAAAVAETAAHLHPGRTESARCTSLVSFCEYFIPAACRIKSLA